jgi:putative nucleotidyltransferase-like protein
MNKELAEAIVTIFRDGGRERQEAQLVHFNLRDWERTFSWLDGSGLALYLLDRIRTLRLEASVPAEVLDSLNQKQLDNEARTDDIFQEFMKINIEFQRSNVRYLNLKGLTLVPRFCSDPTLRFQLDLDFLVYERDAKHCSEILMMLGYLPVARSGNTWEFKASGHVIPLMRDMYKPKPQRSVELHLVSESRANAATSAFLRRRFVTWRDFAYPALCESDLFLSQSNHLFKHLLSEWTRPSWVWEYRMCVVRSRDDETFWREVKERTAQTGYRVNAIRAAARLASTMFGTCEVPALDEWIAESLPRPIDLWIDRYGKDILMAKFPGSKLYLLLKEKGSDTEHLPHRGRMKKLLPVRRPLPITVSLKVKKLSTAWWSRLSIESRYFGFRLNFHVTAGLRYLLEVPCWKRAVADVNG